MSLTECRCCERGKDGTRNHTELSHAVKTSTGEHDFASCSNHVDNYRRAGCTTRKLEGSDKMRIGEHEVKVLSKTEVQIGCQRVSREQVEQVLKALSEHKSRPHYLKFNSDPGSTLLPDNVAFYLDQDYDSTVVSLKCRFTDRGGVSRTNWVVKIKPDGTVELPTYIAEDTGLEHTDSMELVTRGGAIHR